MFGGFPYTAYDVARHFTSLGYLPGFVKMFGVILHEYVRDLPTIELQLNTVRGLLPYLPVFDKMLRVSA
jgi:hypothetical protein